jgi:hypothetical protein
MLDAHVSGSKVGRALEDLGHDVKATAVYVVGAGLALYWTRISPLSFGATIPVFAITFVLYLAIRSLADRKASSPAEPEKG